MTLYNWLPPFSDYLKEEGYVLHVTVRCQVGIEVKQLDVLLSRNSIALSQTDLCGFS